MANKDLIDRNLAGLTHSARKAFLTRAFGGEDYAARAAELRRETLARPLVYVGAGTCGLAAGAAKTLEAARKYLKDNKLEADILEVGCIGLCAAEPLLDVQIPGQARVSFQRATGDTVPALLDSVFRDKAPLKEQVLGQFEDGGKKWPRVPLMSDHPFFGKQLRFVLKHVGIVDPNSIQEHIARGGYGAFLKVIHTMTPAQACDAVEASGLRGRGGGGFPTGKKWKIALASDADQKYIICNADEGDPGAFMDRSVIEGDPHRVLEGIAIGAYAIHAGKAYIYIRAEYPLAIKNLKKAIADAKAYGLLGENIYGSGFDLDVIIKTGAGAFVCGEETALMNSIEGRRGNPRIKPPFPAQAGLFGFPTTINNVETLAAVPHILTRGADWYRDLSLGNPKSTGTKLISVCGHVMRQGNYEITMGTPMRDLIFDMCGGMRPGRSLKAVIPGGSSVPILSAAEVEGCVTDYEGVVAAGSMLGSGGMIVMDDSTDIVYEIYRLTRFYAHESCAQCTQCREGTGWTARILERILQGDGKAGDLDLLLDLAENMTGKTICVLSDSCAAPVVSGIQKFRADFEAYLTAGRSPALAGV
jgi:NADH-quinone oxidoreductase F subunit